MRRKKTGTERAGTALAAATTGTGVRVDVGELDAVPEMVGVKVKGAGEAEVEVVPVVEVADEHCFGEREKRRITARIGRNKFIAPRSNNCN